MHVLLFKNLHILYGSSIDPRSGNNPKRARKYISIYSSISTTVAMDFFGGVTLPEMYQSARRLLLSAGDGVAHVERLLGVHVVLLLLVGAARRSRRRGGPNGRQGGAAGGGVGAEMADSPLPGAEIRQMCRVETRRAAEGETSRSTIFFERGESSASAG